MERRNKAFISGLAVLGILGYQAYKKNKRKINFKNKIVVLTGASRGLGLVLARQLAKEGARLAICGRDQEKLQKAKNELEAMGVEVLAIPCDLTLTDQLENFAQNVIDKYGYVDVLINNAGTDIVSPIENTTLKDYEDLMNLHFWAPLHLCNKFVPIMKQRGGGRIVNISSIGGKVTMPHMVAYSSSKHALAGYSDGLRAELKKDNILVTTVCPGFLRTGTQHNVSFKGQNKKEFAWFSYVISLPMTSMNSEVAARKIINACRIGKAELIMPTYAKALSILRNLMPESVLNFSSFINNTLPEQGGIGSERALGNKSYSKYSPSIFTKLSDMAALRNNQFN